jgi:hypothetical protein
MLLKIKIILFLLLIFLFWTGCKSSDEKVLSNVKELILEYQFENEELIFIDFHEKEYFRNQFLSLIEYPKKAAKHKDKVFILFGTKNVDLDTSLLGKKYILADKVDELEPITATVQLGKSEINNYILLDINKLDEKLISLTKVNEKGKLTSFSMEQYLGIPIPGDENFMLINKNGKSYDEVSFY